MTGLPVRVSAGVVRIGPVGCPECFATRRRRMTGRDQADVPDSPLLTESVRVLVAALADHVARDSVLELDLADLSVRRRRFLPDPTCEACGDLPPDRPGPLAITGAHPKRGPDTHRSRSAVETLPRLLSVYVDDETGVVRAVNPGAVGPFVVAGAPVPLRPTGAFEPGFGRSPGYRASEATAVLEALERYGGVTPGGRRTVVRGSFAELAGHALDPRTLGTHPPESHALPDFPYRPFAEDAVCDWVWGHSLVRDEPVLVPERYAYYSTTPGDDRPFVWEMGNGCALGSGFAEAVLHGLFEVVERDAFLLTWYARLPVPRLDLPDGSPAALRSAAITAATGHDVLLFDTTPEYGIPAVWAMAVHPDGEPAVVCAGGAGPTPAHAAVAALDELGPIAVALSARFAGRPGPPTADPGPTGPDTAGPDTAGPSAAGPSAASPDGFADPALATDPDLVRGMADHCALSGLRAVLPRFDFLLDDEREHRPLTSAGPFKAPDLGTDLAEAVRRLAEAGLDVVVVDQTTPEHRAADLVCVKVVVPGAVPMTFGHRNRRVEGLPRLLEIPRALGYADHVLSVDELNPHPHPFP
ncbi:TOMM precursor leader peptide-binding protein [Saccharothrix violaceirubra]|uniref:Ribosomal protein S12 methylthiotransferase accessory factor n=1 Tax=Saccharothrix violaceirubra TaxID=413306 RepID=A0A7W7WX12_9PSEU|nr:TOMM precursor leader peptide-binding protein [Saccharothrix violaceirubra]MBB4966646.1 ribosomal protein S12 methylthiotransferase accessory factor [Saccharothrix violaceirubra]